VLGDDGNLHLNVVFFQMVMLPKVGADAKVIAVDVNENVIAYGNNDFVERFETNEGIIRTRYFPSVGESKQRSAARSYKEGCWRSMGGENGGGSGRSTIK